MLIEIEKVRGFEAYRAKAGRFFTSDDRFTTIATAVNSIENDMRNAHRAYCAIPDSMLTQEGRIEKDQLKLLFD